MSTNDPGPGNEGALETLRRGERFLLVGHERPDGDCLGSQAALARVLQKLGKEVRVQNPDPPSPAFRYLTEGAPFTTWSHPDRVPEHDVLVLLDFNVLSRTGPMAPTLAAGPARKVVVDHHVSLDPPWWDAAYVDVTASATGLLVRRIARDLGVELDATIARAVFTSIVTDTGWFRYSNTDAETLAVAAELLEHGIAPAEVYRAIHQQAAPSEPVAIGRALARTEYKAGGRLAVVDWPVPENGAPDLEDTDTVLDVLRAVAGVEVVLLLRQRRDGRVKLSARSKTSYDVNALAREFGGGGHAKAAGATLDGPLAVARKRLCEAAEARFGAPSAQRR